MNANPPRDVIHPVLSAEQIDVLRKFSEQRQATAGDDLFCADDVRHDMFVVLSGLVGVISRFDGVDELVSHHTAGELVGELDLLTGQRSSFGARMLLDGEVLALAPETLRTVIATAPDIGDIIVETLVARRELLLDDGSHAIQVAGSRHSPASLALREYLTRNRLPHCWIDDPAGLARLLDEQGVADDELPTAMVGRTLLRSATPRSVADHLGLTTSSVEQRVFDLIVVGAGPAGLAAAVYGASEGLDTLTVEAVAPGGQAGTSSRIENYLGFPSGVTGAALTDMAITQALKFGARLCTPCEVASVSVRRGNLDVVLADGTTLEARAVIAATGATYRRLDLPRLEDFEGTSVYYAATEVEARLVADTPAVIVGGGNAAGQAALFLAKYCNQVSLVVRSDDLASSMSSYLAARIAAHPVVTIHCGTQVTELHGDHELTAVTLAGPNGDELCDSAALFSFIGAVPSAGWLSGLVETDGHGFVRTCRDLSGGRRWRSIGRTPQPYETSEPGLFAVGDVRSGSIKRVASAVGEGAAVIRSVHGHLAALRT